MLPPQTHSTVHGPVRLRSSLPTFALQTSIVMCVPAPLGRRSPAAEEGSVEGSRVRGARWRQRTDGGDVWKAARSFRSRSALVSCRPLHPPFSGRGCHASHASTRALLSLPASFCICASVHVARGRSIAKAALCERRLSGEVPIHRVIFCRTF